MCLSCCIRQAIGVELNPYLGWLHSHSSCGLVRFSLSQIFFSCLGLCFGARYNRALLLFSSLIWLCQSQISIAPLSVALQLQGHTPLMLSKYAHQSALASASATAAFFLLGHVIRPPLLEPTYGGSCILLLLQKDHLVPCLANFR